jgi:hypothetical protein
MTSPLTSALGLDRAPVALLWSDTRPEHALSFEQRSHACIMTLFAAAVAGSTVAFERHTCGCPGGATGLGFGDGYQDFYGGADCAHYFLSTGNSEWETGRRVGADLLTWGGRTEFYRRFMEGERFCATPAAARDWHHSLPLFDVPARYVVLAPLDTLPSDCGDPIAVTFVLDPDGFTALLSLAQADRPAVENILVPHAAACQTIGIFSYREAIAPHPRLVVGPTDVSARLELHKTMGANFLLVSVPYRRLRQLETMVDGSLLTTPVWQELLSRRTAARRV